MENKPCGAPLNEEETVCTECEATAELQETAAEECAEAAEETKAEAAEEPAKKNTGLIVALVACVAAIIVLLVMLISGGKSQPVENEPPIIPPEEQTLEETGEAEAGAETGGIDEDWLVQAYVPEVSYVYDDIAFFDEAKLAEVVATCGDSELTVEMLTYYYWREFYTFANMYSSQLSYMMDPYGRLDQQQAITGEGSWDELFMRMCIQSYNTYAAAASEARANNYELTADERAGLDNIPAEMQTYAELYGYADADAYIRRSFGPYSSMAGYMAFMEEYMLGASYLEYLLDQEVITPDVIDAYYEEHKDDLVAAGLEKDDRPMVNIRHILFMPANVEIAEGEAGYEEAMAAALADAEAAANEVYDLWKSGAMTEESFGELAMEHSVDGSAAAGGLIENIYPGQTVENFDAWCFTEGRKVGDHGLVQTEFGYHIIYLSGVQEQSYWYQKVLTEYENERYMAICDEIVQRFPVTSDLTKAAVYPVNTEINTAQ